MKPIQLTMTAFGPYGDDVCLDFREMEGRTFFLINGPTGSGKTTILDGICFALYGVTSGAERQARQMRSQYSDEGTLTKVVFDFALGRDAYRVERTPEQMRPRKRGGDGLVAVKSEATLWRRTGLDDDGEEGTVIASGISHVTQAIMERLGCTEEQFRQVIMLPQGQFRRFLMSGTAERQEILETLFQTEIYRRIEEALHQAAGQNVDAIKELRKKREVILGQSDVETMDQLLEARQKADAGLLEITDKLAALRAKETADRNILNQAEQTEVKFREQIEAGIALESLEKQRMGFSDRQKRLEAARRAWPVTAAETAVADRRREVQEAGRKKSLAGKVLETARADREKCLDHFRRAESDAVEIDPIKARLAHLETLVPLVEELHRTRLEWDQAQKDAQKKQTDKNRLKENLDRLQKQLETAQKTLRENTVQANQADRLEWDVRTLEKALGDLRRLTDLTKRHESLNLDCQTAHGRVQKLEAALAGIRQEIETGERQRHQAQAAALAQDLEAGQPCPVCGATHHPAPARVDGHIPSENDLKKRRKQASDQEKEIKKASKAEMDLEKERAGLQSSMDGLRQALDQYQNQPLEAMDKELAAKTKALTESQKAAALVQRLNQELETLTPRVRQVQDDLVKAEDAWRQSEEKRSGIQAVFQDRQAKLPPGLAGLEALNQAKAKESRRLGVLEKALQGATQKAQAAAESHARAEAALVAADAAEKEAQDRLAEQQRRFDRLLEQAGFTGLEDFQAARMPEAGIDDLEREIKAFEKDLAAAENRQTRAQGAVAGLKRPDIPSLIKAVRETQNQLEQVIGEQTRVKERIARMVSQVEQLNQVDRDLKSLEDRYYVVGRISEVALGKNPYKLTFQRFVLQTFLDEVLTAATSRLLIMSSGRYQLQRTTDVGDRRTAGGLDLQVFDAYTGQARPVATLSGGESFLAALALALGLADVVQAHSGGIHLDTIFVDEGFGSLDPEALDLALRALVDLQKGGRLVGIISHVPELKERINTRLEVSTSHTGSRAKFVLG